MPLHDVSASEGDWLSFTPNTQGVSGEQVNYAIYCIVGKTCLLMFDIQGTSTATTKSITLPALPWLPGSSFQLPLALVEDNGVFQDNPGRVQGFNNTASVSLLKNGAGDAWTASGTWRVWSAPTFYPIR